MSSRRRVWLGVVGAMLLLVTGLVWSLLPRAGESESRRPSAEVWPAVEVPAEPAVREPTPAPRSTAATDRREPDGDAKRRRADALRAAISIAARAREGVDEGSEPAAATPGASAPSPGSLRDRIGGRDELVAALNEDFMPLADECIQQARERTPDLEGMLAVGVTVIADADLGAVIETVDYPDRNEVAEAGLLECIRETALSTTLPSPGGNGQEEFLLTLPVGE